MRPGAPRRGGPAQPSPTVAAAMAGAVDLAAVKARNEAAARAAEAPKPAPGQYVVDVTEASFQAEVIDRSFQVPVLLDLWAEWCEPCKQLSPVLERLANNGFAADPPGFAADPPGFAKTVRAVAAGSWVLAKIDTDANQRIATALQVQSIPSVFAVIGGQILPGFQGALPEAQVREFVAAVLQAAEQAGLSGADAPAGGPDEQDGQPAPPEEPADPRFTAAEQALDAGDFAGAEQRYQAILDEEPGNELAALALGQVRLLQRLESVDRAAAARADSAPTDVDAQLAAADLSFANNDVQAALDRLLATVGAVQDDDRDRVRERLIEYFDLLGPDDPRVPAARRALTRALF